MPYLVDANILLRASQPHHPLYNDAVNAVEALLDAEADVYLIPQILYEFWAVATRPATARGGLGFTPVEAQTAVGEFLSDLTLLRDRPELYDEWQSLVSTHGVSGMDSHDARIVAAMHLQGIDRILTFNVDDFRRYTTITAVAPQEILTPSP
jgi:predicted nucleic acid-binding protein